MNLQRNIFVLFIMISSAHNSTAQDFEIFCEKLSGEIKYPATLNSDHSVVSLTWYDLSRYSALHREVSDKIKKIKKNEKVVAEYISKHSLDLALAKAYYPHVKVEYLSITPPAILDANKKITILEDCQPETVMSTLLR